MRMNPRKRQFLGIFIGIVSAALIVMMGMIIRVIILYSADPINDQLWAAVNANDYNQIIVSVKRGADPNMQWKGRSALFQATLFGHAAAIRGLLDVGADVNGVCHYGPALIAAAWQADPAIVQLLLTRGADPNLQHRHTTALMEAARYGKTAVIEQLMAADADVTLRDSENKTAEQIAFEHGHVVAARALRLLKQDRPKKE
jgi:ankyrin repeat protein